MEDSQRSTLRNEDAAAPGAVSDLPGLAAKFQRSGADGCGCGCTWIWNRFPRKAGVWNCLRAGRHSTARVGGGLRRRECDSRSEAHTSELQYLMRSSYSVFCLKKQNTN